MAKDYIHYFVKEALENEGWTITADPLTIDLSEDDTFFDVDLSAEKTDEQVSKKIVAIEVKSFSGGSIINAFHQALGQFLNYQAAIAEQGLDMELFLAVSKEGWERLNEYKFIQRRTLQYGLRFIVVDLTTKNITKWTK